MQDIEKRRSGLGRFFAVFIIMAMVLPASYGFSTLSDTTELFEASSNTIKISHAGLEFDNSIGEPTLAMNMMSENSDKYIVQFRGPVMPAWKQDLEDLGAKVFQYIEDYAYVVEMEDSVKSKTTLSTP